MLSPPDASCSNSNNSTPYPSDHSESESAVSYSVSGQSISASPLPSQSAKSTKPKSGRKRRLSATAKKTVLILLKKGQETKSARSLIKLAKRRSLSKKNIPSISVLEASQSAPIEAMANFYHEQQRRASAQNVNGSYATHSSMMTASVHSQKANKSSEIGSNRNKNTVHFARPYIDDSTDHTYKQNLSANEVSSPVSMSNNSHSKPKDHMGLSPEIQSTRAHSPSWSSRSGPVLGRCRVRIRFIYMMISIYAIYFYAI